MSILDRLKSGADAINAGRVAQQQAQIKRAAPREVPFDIREAYYVGPDFEVPCEQPPTYTVIGPDAPLSREPMNEAQRAGAQVQGGLAGRYLATNELRNLATGGRSA